MSTPTREATDRELSAVYDLLDTQRLRADTAEAELAKLSELLKKFFEFVEMAPVSSGVCCCGSDTSQANHGDHMAVDQWDHSVSLWGREIEDALSTASPATINQQGEEA